MSIKVDNIGESIASNAVEGVTEGIAREGAKRLFDLGGKKLDARKQKSIEKVDLKKKEKEEKKLQKQIENARAQAKKKRNVDTDTYVNIAFIGGSGNGKSSLINALRQVPDNDKEVSHANFH